MNSINKFSSIVESIFISVSKRLVHSANHIILDERFSSDMQFQLQEIFGANTIELIDPKEIIKLQVQPGTVDLILLKNLLISTQELDELVDSLNIVLSETGIFLTSVSILSRYEVEGERQLNEIETALAQSDELTYKLISKVHPVNEKALSEFDLLIVGHDKYLEKVLGLYRRNADKEQEKPEESEKPELEIEQPEDEAAEAESGEELEFELPEHEEAESEEEHETEESEHEVEEAESEEEHETEESEHEVEESESEEEHETEESEHEVEESEPEEEHETEESEHEVEESEPEEEHETEESEHEVEESESEEERETEESEHEAEESEAEEEHETEEPEHEAESLEDSEVESEVEDESDHESRDESFTSEHSSTRALVTSLNRSLKLMQQHKEISQRNLNQLAEKKQVLSVAHRQLQTIEDLSLADQHRVRENFTHCFSDFEHCHQQIKENHSLHKSHFNSFMEDYESYIGENEASREYEAARQEHETYLAETQADIDDNEAYLESLRPQLVP